MRSQAKRQPNVHSNLRDLKKDVFVTGKLSWFAAIARMKKVELQAQNGLQNETAIPFRSLKNIGFCCNSHLKNETKRIIVVTRTVYFVR